VRPDVASFRLDFVQSGYASRAIVLQLGLRQTGHRRLVVATEKATSEQPESEVA